MPTKASVSSNSCSKRKLKEERSVPDAPTWTVFIRPNTTERDVEEPSSALQKPSANPSHRLDIALCWSGIDFKLRCGHCLFTE
jgi:hypothetical protein